MNSCTANCGTQLTPLTKGLPAPASLGTDAVYLAAVLFNIIDEDNYIEDCTTIPHHPERKKHHSTVMGGM
jgi:hypothetical protein